MAISPVLPATAPFGVRDRPAQKPTRWLLWIGRRVDMDRASSSLLHGHGSLCFFFQHSFLFFRRQLFRFENDDKPLERSGECKRHFVHVVLHHWSSRVLTDIESLIQRKTGRDRSRNLPLRDLLAVNKQRPGGAFADAASVVLEAEAYHVVARRERLIGSDAELVLRLV